jgi:acyl-coenzyme A synthetase/AMP-(fatty) acid ligase
MSDVSSLPRFGGALPPARFNMAQYCLARQAAAVPDKIALSVVNDPENLAISEDWTFSALQDRVLRLADGFLTAGLAPGDRIMIRLENTSAYALTFFAAIAAGLVAVPTSSQLSAREAQFMFQDSGARAVILSPGLGFDGLHDGVLIFETADLDRFAAQGSRAEYAPSLADDPAYVIYTSGTTSNPKGVLHAHRAVWGRRPMYQGWYGIAACDRMLHAGAFNWTYTLGTGLSDPWANGASAMIYTGAKTPDLWPRLIRRHDITLFAAVPTVFRQILKYADGGPLTSLRHGLTAGEALPQSVADEWRTVTGTWLYEALGMSELSTFISSSPNVAPRPGAVGRAQPGRSVVVLPAGGGIEPLGTGEAGLLAAHSSDPGLMLGYWNRPEEQKDVFRGDWFCGGDMVVMDQDGYVFHQGRADDVMNALGYRVSPLEVENVLNAHDDVADVAVTEIAVRADVSVIGAFIVARAGARPDMAALGAFAAGQLASYKVPREFVLIDQVPRTANGKIKRGQLRAEYRRN